MIQHQISHVLDAAVVGITAAVTAISSAILAQTAPATAEAASNTMEIQLLLLPLIGALVASGGMIMLNPNPETRRITIGRGIFALFFGVLIPQVIGIFFPSWQPLVIKPAVLVLSGGLISVGAYVLSKPFTRELYERAEGIAKAKADELQKKLTGG